MTVLADNVAWFVTRAGGMVALALLTVSVLVGIGLAGRARLERWPRFAIESVHRFAGMLAWVFIGVHGLVLLADSYLDFTVADLVLPGIGPYRPLATGLGVVSLELLLALAVTNRLRTRLPHSVWRRAHYLNFAVWLLAVAHGIAAGTDTGAAWAMLGYALACASVLGMLAWRIGARRLGAGHAEPAAPVRRSPPGSSTAVRPAGGGW